MSMKDNIAYAAKRTYEEFQKRLPEQTEQAVRMAVPLIVGGAVLLDQATATERIVGYDRTEKEVIPPNEEGLSLWQIGNDPIIERTSIFGTSTIHYKDLR